MNFFKILTFGENEKSLMAAYRIWLDISTDRAKRSEVEIDPKLTAILALSEREMTWEKIFEAEQRLLPSLTEHQISSEAERRFLEAKNIDVPSVEVLRNGYDLSTDPQIKRAYFSTLMDDLHYRHLKRSLDRRARRQTAGALNWTGFALLVLIFFLLVYAFDPEHINNVAKFHIIGVLVAGILGAYLSRMIAFQRSLDTLVYDDLRNGYSYYSLLIRIILGLVAALTLYFMFMGNIVSGELFPKIEIKDFFFISSLQGTDGKTPSYFVFPTINLSKLLVWSFLAGFSERLVPDQFTKLENSNGAVKTQ